MRGRLGREETQFTVITEVSVVILLIKFFNPSCGSLEGVWLRTVGDETGCAGAGRPPHAQVRPQRLPKRKSGAEDCYRTRLDGKAK